jgi:hypothetical protein
MTATTATSILLSDISTDEELQPRARINQAIVEEYAEAMSQGETFLPVIIFNDGENKWLADGYHRYYAGKRAGLSSIGAEFRTGTKSDALKFSLSANAAHGLRRSQADKRRAVLTALENFSHLSNREIARLVKVDDKTVGKYRERRSVVREVNNRIAAGESFVGSHGEDLLFIFKLTGPYVRMFWITRDSSGTHMIYDKRGCNIKWNICHVHVITDFRLDMADFEHWLVIPNDGGEWDAQAWMKELAELPGVEVGR